MQIKNSTGLAYGYTRTSRRPPQPEMTLIVRGKFLLVPGGVVKVPDGIPLVAQGSVTGDVFDPGDDDHAGEIVYPGDLAEFKLNAEVMLRGSCHAPGGKPVAECPVRFAVGGWSKILRVVGARVWTEGVIGARPTDPIPFTRMPLTYANAFGGAGSPANPVGKGLGTAELPTVESPAEPIRSRNDRPAPASFAPVNPAWPERHGKTGKLPSKLSAGRGSAYHGEDFDWTYFHAAPPDQQIRGYLRGDEEIVLQNLHPTIQVLSTRLPGLRVRAFVKDVDARLREVRMNLDTLFVDMDAEAVYLTWRGVEAVKEIDLLDVQTVLFASEDLSATPLSLDPYRAAIEAFEKDPKKRLDEVLPEASRQEVEGALEAARAAREARASGDPVGNILEGKLGMVGGAAREGIRRSLADLVATGAKQGIDIKDHLARALSGVRPPDGKGSRGGARNALRAVQERMESLRKDARGAQAAELAAYDQILADPRMAALGLTDGSGKTKPPEEPGPGRDLSGEDLSHQDLSGRDLTGARFERAILTGANLKNARLGGASLKQAVLSEADLTGADLAGADLTEALLTQARAPGANLAGATLSRTVFHEADLTGANLTEAKGETPIFSKTILRDASARRARFTKPAGSEAILERADLSGAELEGGVFAHCDMKGVNLSGAALNRMSFLGSNLTGANLTDARGEQTTWIEADLTASDFSHAALPRALFNQARAPEARFFSANLKQGKFYRAALDHADLGRANLYEANFTLASVTGTRFVEANLFDARFVMATGAGYDLSGANLKMAVVEIKNARG